MSDSRTIAQWLSEGLTLFSAGDREGATACWLRVLAADPDHGAAKDYLRAVGETAPAQAEILDDEEELEGPTQAELREEVVDLVSGGMIDEAYELLTTTTSEKEADLETLALLELLRMHLHEDVLVRLGSTESVPRIEMAPEDLMKFNLPAGAGFLISRIDGLTPVEDLVAVSGMDPFETMHTLGRLLEAGIVGVAA